jgi:hypothetical protein
MRLIDRLRREGMDLPDGTRLVHARRVWGRKQNGWSWYAVDNEGRDLGIGSKETVSMLARAGKLVIRDVPVTPDVKTTVITIPTKESAYAQQA